MPRSPKIIAPAVPFSKEDVCWLCLDHADPSSSLCYVVECSKPNCKIIEGGLFHAECLEAYYKRNKLGHLVSTNNRQRTLSACPVGRGKERDDVPICSGRITVVKSQQSMMQNSEKRQQRIAASIAPPPPLPLPKIGSPQPKKSKPPPINNNYHQQQYNVALPPDPEGENVPLRMKPHAIAAPRKKAQAMLAAIGSVPGLTPEDFSSIPLEAYRAKLWGQRSRKQDKVYWSQSPPGVIDHEPAAEEESEAVQQKMRQQVNGQEQAFDGEEADDEAGWEVAGEMDVEEFYTKEQAERDGITIQHWINMGYSAFDLRHAGYSALDLATSGMFSAEELFSGGFSHDELAYLDPALSGLAWASSTAHVKRSIMKKEESQRELEVDDEINHLLSICGL